MTHAAKRLQRTPPEKITVGDWLTHFREFSPSQPSAKSLRHYAEMTSKFVMRYGNRPIQSITPMEAQAWALERPGEVRFLREAWKKATLMQVTPLNIWKLVELPKREKNERCPPTVEELDEILARCRAKGATRRWWLEFADLCEVAAFTGLRRGGIVSLKRADVDLARGRLTVTEKGRKTREVAVAGRGKDALASAMARHPWTPYVFSMPPPLRPIMPHRVSEVWTEIRGDFPESFHCLRHFHATWLLANGISKEDIAIQLGHTDRMGRPYVRHVQRVYAHPAAEKVIDRIREQIEALG